MDTKDKLLSIVVWSFMAYCAIVTVGVFIIFPV